MNTWFPTGLVLCARHGCALLHTSHVHTTRVMAEQNILTAESLRAAVAAGQDTWVKAMVAAIAKKCVEDAAKGYSRTRFIFPDCPCDNDDDGLVLYMKVHEAVQTTIHGVRADFHWAYKTLGVSWK